MNATHLAVISGGLDSAVLAKKLQADGVIFRAIYFDIGYLPRIAERNAAKYACFQLGIPLEIVNVSGIFEMVSGFVPIELLGADEADKGQPKPEAHQPGDPDYVSGFHVIVSLSSYYAMLGEMKTVSVGLIRNQMDHNARLKDFIAQFPSCAGHLNPSRTFCLEAPFAGMYKSEVVQLGVKLGVNIQRTWSCYKAGPQHCGVCPGCLGRKEGFRDARTTDPTTYDK